MKSIFRGAGYETEERYFEEENRRFLGRQLDKLNDADIETPSALPAELVGSPMFQLHQGRKVEELGPVSRTEPPPPTPSQLARSFSAKKSA